MNFEGFWYLIALRNDVLKKYYLKNISSPSKTEQTFKKDTKLDTLLDQSISIWFRRDVEPFEVKLFADKSAAKFFKRRPLPTQRIETLNSDGSIEFSVKITDEMEILPLITYWIPHLFILEPQWIKDTLYENMMSYMNNPAFKKE